MAAAAVLRQQQLEKSELEAVYDWYGLSCPCGLPPGDCRIHPRARIKQRPPDRADGYFQPPDSDWYIWIILAGRGGGKSQSGSKFINDQVEHHGVGEVVLVNATIGDTRDIMVEGPSGLIRSAPPWFQPRYIPSKARVEWPNGAMAYLRTSEEPDGLRGLNASLVWGDEPGKWFLQTETWNQIGFILRNRVAPPPRCVLTGTPTSTPLMYELEDMAEDPSRTRVYMVHWHTLENRIHLAERFTETQVQKWAGTLMGQQELEGIIIRRREGALWAPEDFEKPGFRIHQIPELEYIGVAVDPQTAAPKRPGEGKAKGAETGIVIGGRMPALPGSLVSRGVLLEDRSFSALPGDWGREVVRAYHDWKANEVVAEKNQGGEMVRHVIETVPAEGGYPSGKNLPIRLVHASTGKTARAEPIQGLYQSGRMKHYCGPLSRGLEALERQMVQYLPGKSGQLLDRVDAAVWLLKGCIIDHDDVGESGPIVAGLSRQAFTYQGQVSPWMLP
jgi:phage terminase large subunit-like protein